MAKGKHDSNQKIFVQPWLIFIFTSTCFNLSMTTSNWVPPLFSSFSCKKKCSNMAKVKHDSIKKIFIQPWLICLFTSTCFNLSMTTSNWVPPIFSSFSCKKVFKYGKGQTSFQSENIYSTVTYLHFYINMFQFKHDHFKLSASPFFLI